MSADTRPARVRPISAKVLFGFGGFVTFLTILVVVTGLGRGTANATIAFSNETGFRCAFCHASPGTNMQRLTRFGNCFRNHNYNARRCR
jgi:hypothetical protein